MAILNRFTTAYWKNLQGDPRKKQLLILRALHKSAASEASGISAAGEEAMPDKLITPQDVGEKTRIMTLKEMPGPSIIGNLIEFIWKDGFSRIHEIQVMLSKHNVTFLCVLSRLGCLIQSFVCFSQRWPRAHVIVSQMCHLCVKWHRQLRKSAPRVLSTFHSR